MKTRQRYKFKQGKVHLCSATQLPHILSVVDTWHKCKHRYNVSL